MTDKDKDSDEPKVEESKDDEPDIDVDKAVRQIRKGWSVYDAGDLTIGDLYLMVSRIGLVNKSRDVQRGGGRKSYVRSHECI